MAWNKSGDPLDTDLDWSVLITISVLTNTKGEREWSNLTRLLYTSKAPA